MFLSPEQLEKIDICQPIGLPVSEKSKNRLYLSWRNGKGSDCKMIGPQTKCFCNHKFKDHDYHNAKVKKAPCTSSKCKCKTFDYIPSHGAYDFKCLCKHSFKQHDCITRKCTKEKCQQCNGFASAWTCSCSFKFAEHQTIIQTYEERKQSGKSVNDMGRLNDQLNFMSQQGSLLKPIKMDPEQRAKQRRSSENNPFVVGYGGKKKPEQEEIQQYKIAMNYNYKQ